MINIDYWKQSTKEETVLSVMCYVIRDVALLCWKERSKEQRREEDIIIKIIIIDCQALSPSLVGAQSIVTPEAD